MCLYKFRFEFPAVDNSPVSETMQKAGNNNMQTRASPPPSQWPTTHSMEVHSAASAN